MWMLPVVLYYFYTKALVYTWFLWLMLLTAIFAYISSSFLVPFYEKIEQAEADREEAKEREKAEAEAKAAAEKAQAAAEKAEREAANKAARKKKK